MYTCCTHICTLVVELWSLVVRPFCRYSRLAWPSSILTDNVIGLHDYDYDYDYEGKERLTLLRGKTYEPVHVLILCVY